MAPHSFARLQLQMKSTTLILYLTRAVGLQNKDLALVGACRQVCSSVVRSSSLHSAPFRRLALHHYQHLSRAAVRQKKNESHVSKNEVKAMQHAQRQAKPSAKHGAYRDEDGPEEANRWARSATTQAHIHLPAPSSHPPA